MQWLQKISVRQAALTLLAIFTCVVVLHLLVLTGVVPHDIVWGGRLQGASQVRSMALVSLCVNLACMAIVAARAGLIKSPLPARHLTVLLKLLVLLFALNTLGNLFAASWFETLVFTPLTLVATVLLYRLATASDDQVPDD